MKKFIGDIKMFVKCAKHIEYLCKGLVFLHIVNAIFNSVSPFINIYMAARIVDMILAGEPWKETLMMAGITAGLNFFVVIMKAILKYFISVRRSVFNYNYKYSKNHKISEMDYDYVDTVEIQQTLNKIYQYENMNGGGLRRFESNLPTMIGHVFTIIFSVAMTLELFISHYPENLVGMAKYIVTPYFAIFILAINAFSVWFTSHCHTKNTRFESKETLKFTFINQLSSSLLSLPFDSGGAMNIRVYDQKHIIKNSLNDAIDGSYVVLDGCADYSVKNEIIPCSIMETATQIILYTFAGISALVGRFSIGSISQYISSIFKFTGAVSALVNTVEMLRVNNEITKIYFDFIERPSHMVQGTLPVEKRDDREYEVEFRDVSFKYPNTDSWALHHVNFKFKIGERLAVVGMNGSGKTTMIKLMCRLYDPTEGQILLNGIDIRKYDYKEYHSIFSVVFQDFQLFAFKLGQNVAASTDYNEEQVKKSLIEANFGERLDRLEKGAETYLYRNFEKDGVEISGGEAQKIALARALYKNAPFIILDEPTAALDPIAEAEVYSNFNSIVGDKTAIYISHRLSSCRFCDRIAVFDGGSVVQFGTHDELLANENGKYYELWTAQAQYYTT
ncbi:MAG: ABC transporter ATP-binding protein [Clostridia bacterium]|nr:ABC transporter ATP-binding protein [Clostridia bacterium]